MKVEIAGYNLDYSQIQKLENQHQATPETISAAYARISRSSKSVGELRSAALGDVVKAKASNQSIVFEMGHASVAEHAVFNFDITGISRLLVEDVQRSRLASFTEKSQRYVTLKGDYLLPPEIAGTALENEFREVITSQNNLYFSLYEKALIHLKQSGFAGSSNELRGKAKEDARYVLALATQTQFGMTINARSLERLLQRLDKNELAEARELKEALYQQAISIAPSLVRYTKCEACEKHFFDHLPIIDSPQSAKQVELVDITPQAEDNILAGMIFEKSGGDIFAIQQQVQKLTATQKAEIFQQMFCGMKSWQRMPRAFELADLTFSLLISSSCFGQLKRHRMSTILRSSYQPENGYVIPQLIDEIGGRELILPVMQKVGMLYKELERYKPGLGSYILTNGHRLPVLFKANLRELYHFSRLRSDAHAQWEIREVSQQIDSIIQRELPNAGKLIMGKDEFGRRETSSFAKATEDLL
ncbi:MAG: FAD-dependent thymidylate synthase [Candidatus Cloacimonetes bacterium]|nr:FAD-dependent thymidylate synthase [Candidatus Cloacimonadota bacterium]